MNRYFWVGLSMMILNLVGVLAYIMLPKVGNISFGQIVVGGMWIAYTAISTIFLAKGLSSKE